MRKLTRLLIGAFYLVVVAFSVVCLATGQFRSSSGSAYDTWRLLYRSNRILKAYLGEKLAGAKEIAKENWTQMKWQEYCLDLFDSSGRLNSGVEARTAQDVGAVRTGTKKPGDLQGEAWCVVRGLTNTKYDVDRSKKEEEESDKKLFDLTKLLTAEEEQYSDLVKGHQEFLALYELESSKYERWVVTTPYDVLVLLLVMSMGALGGIIRILRDYGSAEHPDPSTRDYFLVPLIGAIVAVGGYVLAKTGLLLLSSTKGETSLSPFMIGLVGMVSGLMAKEVIDRMAAYGRSLLKVDNGGRS